MESGSLEESKREIEGVIEAFVGEQDNVTFLNLAELKEKFGFTLSSALVDSTFLNLPRYFG